MISKSNLIGVKLQYVITIMTTSVNIGIRYLINIATILLVGRL